MHLDVCAIPRHAYLSGGDARGDTAPPFTPVNKGMCCRGDGMVVSFYRLPLLPISLLHNISLFV